MPSREDVILLELSTGDTPTSSYLILNKYSTLAAGRIGRQSWEWVRNWLMKPCPLSSCVGFRSFLHFDGAYLYGARATGADQLFIGHLFFFTLPMDGMRMPLELVVLTWAFSTYHLLIPSGSPVVLSEQLAQPSDTYSRRWLHPIPVVSRAASAAVTPSLIMACSWALVTEVVVVGSVTGGGVVVSGGGVVVTGLDLVVLVGLPLGVPFLNHKKTYHPLVFKNLITNRCIHNE
ncbi:hypothetical protein Tco_1319227 [Tanacetum coccineum]